MVIFSIHEKHAGHLILIHVGKYEFRHRWSLTLTLAILLPLGLVLGNWQMQRAEQKRAVIALYDAHASASVMALGSGGDELDRQSMLFRQLSVRGYYDLDHQVLLENQKHKGEPGYLVLTPLRINHSPYHVLVNRGWIRQGDDRRFIPDLPGSSQELHLFGRAGDAPSVGMKLGPPGTSGPIWPKRLLYVDLDWLAQETGYQFMPYLLNLEEGETDGMIRVEPAAQMYTAMSPQKHMSYAVQWFSLAGLAVLMYLVLSIKKSKNNIESGVDRGE